MDRSNLLEDRMRRSDKLVLFGFTTVSDGEPRRETMAGLQNTDTCGKNLPNILIYCSKTLQ